MGCCKSTRTPTEPFHGRSSLARSLSVDYGFGVPEGNKVIAYSDDDAESCDRRGSILKLDRTDFGEIFDMLSAEKGSAVPLVPHADLDAGTACHSVELEGAQSDTWSTLPNLIYVSEVSAPPGNGVKKEVSLSSETTTSHRAGSGVKNEVSLSSETTMSHRPSSNVKNELSLGTETTLSRRVSRVSDSSMGSARHVVHQSSDMSSTLVIPELSPSPSWNALPSLSSLQVEAEPGMLMGAQLSMQTVAESSCCSSSFMAVESMTDRALTATPSCQEKETKLQSSMWHRHDVVTGYACKKGHKVDSPNQDSFLIVRSETLYSIFGVFDGHGPYGHDISNFVKEQLPRVLLMQPNLESDVVGSLKNAFEKTQRLIIQETTADRLDAHRSGTTVTLVLQSHITGEFHVAHVGDSRCVLGGVGTNGEVFAQDVTQDHKPELPSEEERIQKAGGEVRMDSTNVHRVYAKGKLYPALSLSRALGDLTGAKYAGVSPEPDIQKLELAEAFYNSIQSSVSCLSLQSVISAGSICTLGSSHDTETANSAPADASASQAWTSVGVNQLGASPRCVGKLPPLSCPPFETEKPVDRVLVDENNSMHKPLLDNIPDGDITTGGMKVSPSSNSPQGQSKAVRFLLICSDGIWEYISSKEAVQIVTGFAPEDAMKAAERLSSIAWDRWQQECHGEVVDDITVVVVNLK